MEYDILHVFKPNEVRMDTGFLSSGFRFKVTRMNDDGTPAEVEITRCLRDEERITLPQTVCGCRVTSVGKSAFARCKQLISVTVPEGVRSIRGWAFQACTNLEHVDLPEGLEIIDRCAFRSCHSLTDMNVPDSVSVIHDWAFQCCFSLRRVRLPAALTNLYMTAFHRCGKLERFEIDGEGTRYVTCDGLLYDAVRHELVMCPEGKTGEVRIPEGTLSVFAWAFDRCIFVTSVSIPSTVADVDRYIFASCCSLKQIIIPSEACKRMKPLMEECEKFWIDVNTVNR